MQTGETEMLNGKADGFTLLITDRPAAGRRATIFFDGVCRLCQGIAKFILRRDRARYFQFVPLQSQFAREILDQLGVRNLDEVALLEDGRLYTASTAALRIARNLDGPCKALCLFLAVPRPVRDWLYRRISERRYRWFGESPQCLVPVRVNRGQRLRGVSILTRWRTRLGKPRMPQRVSR